MPSVDLVLADGLPEVSVMHTYMLVQVGLLREGLPTILVGALKGPLARVRAQVVEEVVPLSKDHRAAGEVAFHYANSSLGLLVLEAEHAERTGFRDVVVIDVDVVHVNVLAQLHLHVRVRQDLLEQKLVASLLRLQLVLEVLELLHQALLR